MAVIHGDWRHNGVYGAGELHGTADNDVMYGYEGQDDLYGGGGDDVLYGHQDQDYLLGEAGDDVLYGGDGGSQNYDVLIGGDGNDILDGGLGGDDMRGGNGDDIYYVDNAGDGNSWLENPSYDNGFDEVRASVSYTLLFTAGRDDSIELLTLLDGAGAINGTGNSIANIIVGNGSRNVLQGLSGNDTLEGGGGNDTLMGGLHNDWLDGGTGADDMYGASGDDIYVVDNVGDVTSEFQGSGHDTVRSSITVTLAEGIEDLVLVAGAGAIDGTGNGGANQMYGNASDNELRGEGGADLLKGGGGADYLRGGAQDDELQGGSGDDQLRGDAGDDHMIGGAGNDSYLVDSHGDIVDEAVNQGIDTVTVIGLDYYTLPLDVENLNQSSGVYGTGNGLGNVIVGNLFDNILDGAGGADTLEGRQGDDIYFVDSGGDVIIESGGQGNDEVRASVTYTLTAGADVETLRTTNDNGTAAINLTGNGSGNRIVGNNGNNTLNGGGGADQLVGRGGSDTYIVDSQSDVITENGGQGNDTVRASVSYTLTAGADVETVETTLSTGTQAINLTGNNTGNIVRGNNGNNTLSGGGGNDSLTGLGGSDRFLFDTALDAAFNVDEITDFSVADDFIVLDTAVFTALAPPDLFLRDLTAAEFVTGTAAQDASDRIIYNNNTGALLYDSDGVGGTAAIQFAEVTPGLALTNLDFLVV